MLYQHGLGIFIGKNTKWHRKKILKYFNTSGNPINQKYISALNTFMVKQCVGSSLMEATTKACIDFGFSEPLLI